MSVAQSVNGVLRRLPTWPVYLAGVLAPLWLFWLAVTGGLGVDPVKGLEHELGRLGLQVLIAGLAVTPIRRLTGISLLKFRRALGLIGFGLIAAHLLTWLVLDVQILAQIWADIIKRPYITIGMAGFALLIPLVVTSNNWSIRKLGPRWRRLHKLVYVAVPLGAVHFVMLQKTWQIEAIVYVTVTIALLSLRIPTQTGKKRLTPRRVVS